MKIPRKLLIIVVCLLTVGTFFIANKNYLIEVSRASPSPTPAPRFYANTKPMPVELAYWVLFQEVQSLKEKDAEFRSQGETSEFKSSFYSERLGLEASQFSAVDSAAIECLTNLQPIDQRAREIVDQYRSAYPGGELKKKTTTSSSKNVSGFPDALYERLPPPPAELTQLQNQKNQIILNAKQKIKQSLGQNEFSEFDTLVQKNATKILVPQNLATKVLPSPTFTPSN